jgi:hypothetical protein
MADDDVEKPKVVHAATSQTETSDKTDKPGGHGIFEIVPIEQEAVEDVHHVHLSWRSWVWTHFCPTNESTIS